MSRGKRLDLDIGAHFDEGWSEVGEAKAEKRGEILPIKAHQLVFKREKRRGKVVTLIGRFYLSKADANALLKRVKKRLGAGGSIKDEWMEFQGEQEMKLRELFSDEGFKFKR